MALFSKEPDRNVKIDSTPKPQPAVALPVPPAASAPVVAINQGSAEKPVAPPRSSVAPASEMRAYLDPGSKITGKLSFEGPTRLDGQIDGEIVTQDTLIVGESAVITAQIRAVSIIVAGKVSGDIVASQRIEIRPSAKIIGNLTAPILVVHEGASFEGHCSMQPDTARDDRKVTAFPKEEQRIAQASGGQKLA